MMLAKEAIEEAKQYVQEEPEEAALTLGLLSERMQLIRALANPDMEVHFVQVWHKGTPRELKQTLIEVGNKAEEESARIVQLYQAYQEQEEQEGDR